MRTPLLRHEALLADGTLGAGFTRRRKAERYCTAFEALHYAIRLEWRKLEWAMSHAPHDGRPTVQADSSDRDGTYRVEGVNGKEVRAEERWVMYQPTEWTNTDGTIDRDPWRCYRLLPDGTREAYDPPVREAEERKPAPKPAPIDPHEEAVRLILAGSGSYGTQADYD
jgi:hypothetical protein